MNDLGLPPLMETPICTLMWIGSFPPWAERMYSQPSPLDVEGARRLMRVHRTQLKILFQHLAIVGNNHKKKYVYIYILYIYIYILYNWVNIYISASDQDARSV